MVTEALTPRQREMVEAYGRLSTVPAIAEEFGISQNTVKEHLNQARRKLNVRFTVEAVWALRTRRRS